MANQIHVFQAAICLKEMYQNQDKKIYHNNKSTILMKMRTRIWKEWKVKRTKRKMMVINWYHNIGDINDLDEDEDDGGDDDEF